MEPKKISFGFNKVMKRNVPPSNYSEKNIELISCLENQSIKLINETLKDPEEPLVIPMKENSKTLLSLLNDRDQSKNDTLFPRISAEYTKEHLSLPIETIESKAIRELLAGSQQATIDTTVLSIKPENLPLDGAKESTLDDYESIPISQFGLAMLRGMGWEENIKSKTDFHDDSPILRPKGMGLGADKMIKQQVLLVAPEKNEVLSIKKGACVKILAGKFKNLYGQIEGLDDHAGRVIVKLALENIRETFNEFMVQPVPKREFEKYGKVINSAKLQLFQKLEEKHGQVYKSLKTEIKKELQQTSFEHEKKTNKNLDSNFYAKNSDSFSDYKHYSKTLNDKTITTNYFENSDQNNESYAQNKEGKTKSRKSNKSKRSKTRTRYYEKEKCHKKKTKKSKRQRSRSKVRK